MKQKWAVVILIAAGIIAYGNTAKNGLFWDDDEFIIRNAYIRSFRYLPQWFSQPLTAGAGVNSNYYRPLLQLSFAIDYKLWGLWPAGYHIENLLWHSLAGILLFVFLNNFLPQIFNFQFSCPQSLRDSVCRRAIFNQFSKHKQITISYQQLTIIAFAAALLWLVHPVHVEAVAYANSRGDSMATVFILLSLILWMPPYGWSPVRVKMRFWASAAVFVLALLSKEFAIVTPGLILLVKSLRGVPMAIGTTRQSGSLRNFQSYIDDKRSLLIYITNLASKKLYRLLTIVVNLYNSTKPIFLHITIAVIYLILRLTVLNFQNTLNFYGSNPIGSNICEPQGLDPCNPLELYATSLPTRLLTFLKVLPIYGNILVWPNDLHMERTVEIVTNIGNPGVLSSLFAVSLILIISILSLYKGLSFLRKDSPFQIKGQALRRKAWPYQIPAFAFGWFFISILPVSGLIPISQILAEHFLYLPSIGFFLLVSWIIISLIQKRIPLLIIFYFLLIPLLIKTIRQNRVWRDPITFYEYTLDHAKPTARVYNNLAMAYADRGEHQKAINNYNKAIELGDVYPNPHYNLGNTLMEMGKLDEAEKEYRRALQIDPSFHYATLKLGQMYLDQGKIDDAKNLVCPVFPNQPLCRQF